MRKIEHAMLRAIRQKRNFTSTNTKVRYDAETSTSIVQSYWTTIAVFDWTTRTLKVHVPSDWPSLTTLSRLRALYTYTQAVFYRKGGIIHVWANGVNRKTAYREVLTYPLTE